MRRPVKRRNGGFTYLSLIILVAIIGLVSASALKLGSVLQRSRAEQELLDIGAAFSDALQSYANATPAGFPPQPPSLKELLKDPRFPTVRRHLRKVFVDPMTGKAEWGITYLGDKAGVLAVYSLSDAKPVKIGNFPQRFQGLAGKQKISEWRFAATGGSRHERFRPRVVTLRPRWATTWTSRPVSAVISTRTLPPMRPQVVPG